MRRMLFGAVLVLLALGGSLEADDRDPAFSREAAKELLEKAAEAPPHYVNNVLALGARMSLEDLLHPDANVTLTALVIALGGEPHMDRRDFTLLPGATPKSFAEALMPTKALPGQPLPRRAYASALRPAYFDQVSVEVNGRMALGVVHFQARGVYRGRVHFSAFHGDLGWRILEFTFPQSRIRIALEEGRWRLHVPEGAVGGVNPLRGKALDLPQVGTVGAPPPEATRVVVSVTRDGWIRVPESSGPLSLAELQCYLQQKTNNPVLREMDGASKVDALLDIDATIPWVATQWIMQTCAHPDIKIYRIWLGAQASEGGATGAVTAVLPKDRGLAPTPTFPEDFLKIKVKAFKLDGRGPTSGMRPLYAAMQRKLRAHGGLAGDVKFEIVAPPPKGSAVPHGYVMQLIDVSLAAGARDIVFEGSAGPRGPLWESAAAFKQYLDRMRALPGVPIVKLDNGPAFVPADDATLPPVPAQGARKMPWGAGAVNLMAQSRPVEVVREVPEEAFREPEAPKVKDELPHEDDGLSDAPFEGPANSGSIGIGGGAGGAFRGRTGRSGLATKRKRAADAVTAALDWLAAHQSPNGGWAAQGFGAWCNRKPVEDVSKQPDGQGKVLYDVGVTGLALSAFLSAGHTNRGKHPYAKVVSRGLRYLKNVQDPEGCFGPRMTQQYVYNHAMAALAMVEAYGMTGSPIFKGSAQRCLDYIAKCRNPHLAWRYGIKPGDNDTSVSAWMILALSSAQKINKDAIKRGKPPPLDIDEEAFGGYAYWLSRLTHPVTGRTGYVTRGTGSARPQGLVDRFPGDKAEALTAAAIFTRILMGEDPRASDVIRRGLLLIQQTPPIWNPTDGSIDMYYWHWGSLACWQVGGASWRGWEEALVKALADRQRKDTNPCLYAGSWDPIGTWGLDGGRVYSTALNALSLQAYHRYDRVFGAR